MTNGTFIWHRRCGTDASVRPSRRADVSPFQIMFGVTPRFPLLIDARCETTQVVAENESWNSALQRRKRLVRNFERRKFDPRWRGPYFVQKMTQHSLTLKSDADREIIVNKSHVLSRIASPGCSNSLGKQLLVTKMDWAMKLLTMSLRKNSKEQQLADLSKSKNEL